ncbi:DUF1349 domain-containing protein [Bacillus sp. 03113]|uniref:DUF1349 domain-containing protein n=1 Tax=Bacillus sp. 03113 TaxID=2578211 RepID=UPI0011434969|nr:DUF1349 domain-containing protein [Bacillus sp. 03113]
MYKDKIDWEQGKWSREPESVCIKNGVLIAKGKQGSDYWENTYYGFQHRDGHSLLKEWDLSDAIEVSFSLKTFNGLYDQAGIMVWQNNHKWVKAGVEINDGVPHVGAVVTNHNSDWSLSPVPEWKEKDEVTIRISFFNDSLIIRAKSLDETWRTIRVCPFNTNVQTDAGPFFCSPLSKDFTVHFSSWVKTSPDEELHKLPI